VQIAVALLLVSGATLFARTLTNLRAAPLGFNPYRLAIFDLAPGRNGYDEARGNRLYLRVLERLRQTPGVVSASMAEMRLLTGWLDNGTIRVEGKDGRSQFNFVGPDYLSTMQVPLLMGREIQAGDMKQAPSVAVINEAAARKYFGPGSPLAKHFQYAQSDFEVVGVARAARYDEIRREPQPTIYMPYTQRPWGWPPQLSYAVRFTGNPAQAAAGIRRAVGDVDRMLPLIQLKTMEKQVDNDTVQERLFAWLVGLFGAVTLVLACIGLYGIVASSVAARTREIGIRMALGARRGDVLRMILRQVAAAASAGLLLGLPASWALTRVVESQLYGVKPHDPASLALASATVLLVGAVAALWPARHATYIDPVVALRVD